MGSRDTTYVHAVLKAAMAINSVTIPGDLLTAIVEETAKAMDAKGCSLLLLSPDRHKLNHSASYGLSEQYLRKGPVAVDRSMAEALEGRPISVLDASSDPRLQYRAQAVEEGISSILSVPVTLRAEVIGVLRVYTAKPRVFTREDIEFCQALGSLGVIALENARRYNDVKTSYDAVCQELLEWYGSGPKPASWFKA